MKPKRIKSVDQLLELSKDKPLECFILLSFGLISRKTVRYNTRSKKFKVYHSIDNTTGHYSVSDLLHKSNLGIALDKKVLFREQ